MFVIKFNDKYYLCNPGEVGIDIYKAELFKTKEEARSILKHTLKNYEFLKGWEEPDDGPDTFKVVEVELKEVE